MKSVRSWLAFFLSPTLEKTVGQEIFVSTFRLRWRTEKRVSMFASADWLGSIVR